MGATLRALSIVLHTPSKTPLAQHIRSVNFSFKFNIIINVDLWTKNSASSLLTLRCQFRKSTCIKRNHILIQGSSASMRTWRCSTSRMLRSSNLSEIHCERKSSESESSDKISMDSKGSVIGNQTEEIQKNTDVASAKASLCDIKLNEEGRADLAKDIQLNKKGQVLSNRAKRRLARIDLIKHRASHKKEKQQRKLSDPNADQNAGFREEIFSETEYYFENGLRKVYPYYYTFNAFAKRRWLRRPLIDVFAAEFRAENREFYEEAIKAGTLTVNGSPILLDYTLKEGDLVQNTIHRHENPVTDRPLRIIHEDGDVLVVDKPSSIPCHPCGRYRFNSVVFILGKEAGRPNLRNIYRLDRLTSGVMVCGKTARRTAELERHVLKREVEKEYVCRVVGEFPDGRISVEEPLDVLSNRVAVWKVSANGKPSQTFFEKMSFNGKTSVVKCFPKTGRTHQIRVHLQFLGFPIVNDPIYNSQAFGPLRGKEGDFGKTDNEVIAEIEKVHNVGEWEDGDNPLFELKMEEMRASQKNTERKPKIAGTEDGDMNTECSSRVDVTNMETAEENGPDAGCHGTQTGIDRDTPKTEVSDKSQRTSDNAVKMMKGPTPEAGTEPSAKRLKVTARSDRPGFELSKWNVDQHCRACRRRYLDPSPDNLTMYLHALRYKGPDWDYSTELPDWAQPDFTEEEVT